LLDFLAISSPKRRRSQSKWSDCFPYYAGFPESFARDAIGSADLPVDGVVLDPWNGSGTTTYAASRLGYKSRGIDLNPVMVLIARARALPPSEADSIEAQARALTKNIDRIVGKDLEVDPLSAWFSTDTTKVIRALEKRIRIGLISDQTVDPHIRFNQISCFAATFYVTLFTICRQFTQQYRSSNPTWLRIPKNAEAKIFLKAAEIATAFIQQAKIMASSLQTQLRAAEVGYSEIIVGDSTKPGASASSDFVLSSPPYCTRIDYTAATRIELAIISPLMAVTTDQLSREMIGSVKVPLSMTLPKNSWGKSCNNFLDRLSTHESKASAGYYYKTHVDYFDKLFRSTLNIGEMLKPNALAVLVVQDSHYKDIHNDIALILSEMASEAGMHLERREDYKQSNPLSGINPRAKLYRQTAGATESVLCFKKTKIGHPI